jgi:phosphomannomutase
VNDGGAGELYERARRWLEADPDPTTQAELRALVHARLDAPLAELMGPELDFGTAGLRGAAGPGPSRMNQAVMRRAVRALAEHLLGSVPDARSLVVVVGYDARPSSRSLAEAAAGVLIAAGIPVRWFEQAVPTPLVAYAARVFMAQAALVVTASHNPKADNGLKIYGGDAIQLGPPADADVARRRDAVGPANLISCAAICDERGEPHARLLPIEPELFQRYLAELDASLPPRLPSPGLKIAYTPLHGVGGSWCRAALALRGFDDVVLVREQAEPDGSFPTTPFPNPELPGTVARLVELARDVRADLALANDPDADRLAAAAPESGQVSPLSGNELGVVLADFVLEHAPRAPQPLLVTSIVSSPLLSELAAGHGARAEITLTGFKWLWRAARELEQGASVRLAFACEEALGYSIGQLVRDKDGIAAAVWTAELAERCRREGGTLYARLDAVQHRHGAWGSAQLSLERPGRAGSDAIRAMITRLAASAPSTLGGLAALTFRDFRQGAEARPPWLGAAQLFELSFAGGARVLVRPSGTEPKLKVYADAVERSASRLAPSEARARAKANALELASAMVAWLEASAQSG